MIISTLILLFILMVLLCLYMSRNYTYWKKKGVPFLKPIPLFGNFLDVFLWRKSIGDKLREMYENTVHPYIGFFILDEPILMINDLNLIEHIFIKDFTNFKDRVPVIDPNIDSLGNKMLFFQKSQSWFTGRKRLSPSFTLAKMRSKFERMKSCTKSMENWMRKSSKSHENIFEVKTLFAKFTVDVLSTSFYSIETNSFEQEDSPFVELTRSIANWQNIWHAIQVTYLFLAPHFTRILKLKIINEANTVFFRNLAWDLMNEREKLNIKMNDLVDTLLDTKKNENIQNKYSEEADLLAGLVVTAFVASFETTSTTMTFALYELAKNPEAQQLAREEILRIKNRDGDITYANLNQLKYLQGCIHEAMRLYPVLPFLDRTCTETYKLPGTDVILEKGQKVYFPVMGLHYDSKYYPNPTKFNPERYEDEEVQERFNICFLPFGLGPRACPGKTFAQITMKICIANILTNFKVELSKKHQEPLKINRIGFMMQPDSGVFLKFIEI
ncbi:hypothetical protein HHI36_006527 [Cryptolaemus montrouzieri]|uniref:Cytochrome P450 n=1 Tax=Cryptolaemus montrouzieri TaxID=559131 RepID=A0ABD2NXI8_9CUCU